MLHLWNNQVITGGKVNVLLVFIVPRPHRTSLRVDAQEIFALKKQTMLALQEKLLGSIAQALRSGKPTFWRRQWHPALVLLPEKSHGLRSLVGCGPWGHESRTCLSDFTFTFHFHALKKEMATYSSVLTWGIPGTGEPDGLPSIRLHRVGQNWSNLAGAAAANLHLNSGSDAKEGRVGLPWWLRW